MDLVLVIVMGAVILYQGATNYLEKKRHDEKEAELLNRLMARDYTDYTSNAVYKINANKKPEKSLEDLADDYLRMEAQEGIPIGS